MAMTDDLCLFSGSGGAPQAITVSAASTDSFDTNETAPNKGEGKPIRVRFAVETEFGSAVEDSTLVISLEDDAATGFGTAVKILSTEAIAEAKLVAGYERVFHLPPVHRRYLRLYFTVAGTGDFTAGAAFAKLESG